jgi:hypothetical protein
VAFGRWDGMLWRVWRCSSGGPSPWLIVTPKARSRPDGPHLDPSCLGARRRGYAVPAALGIRWWQGVAAHLLLSVEVLWRPWIEGPAPRSIRDATTLVGHCRFQTG